MAKQPDSKPVKMTHMMIIGIITIMIVASALAYVVFNLEPVPVPNKIISNPISAKVQNSTVKQNKTGTGFSMPNVKLNGTSDKPYKPFDFAGTLFGLNITKTDQIYIVQNIMKNVQLKCYAVGFYQGLDNATFYDDRGMMENIRKYISGASPYDFVRNMYVKDYLEHFCIHLDSVRQLPINYTSGIGWTMQQQMQKWHVTQTSQNLGIDWYHDNNTNYNATGKIKLPVIVPKIPMLPPLNHTQISTAKSV